MSNIVRFPGRDPRHQRDYQEDANDHDQGEGYYIDEAAVRGRRGGLATTFRAVLFHVLYWLRPLLTAPLRAGAAVGLIVLPIGLWWTWDAHQEYRLAVWIIGGVGLGCSALAWGYDRLLMRLDPDLWMMP